ncbi:efflux RND transporter periplasmic adaptor subunit [Microbulbifer thermotolerans]|uniref:efflux RND transporter periplasmic adaptor subunit n=1 Tax=Microbulbifer thermotolerans TaxID=252514 RepID=UPI002248C717|nr:efflux RND transporter periplasmic adaptor subunit [Microbulbifer thermotolerans]MCX2794344.1 efflux RND transporter periplasmic adaptor subunit [Microbulbifer thermotolerans]MCX2835049.1 efflux RND transporter periplasmic adaptor subunit [Microbulbifer thermotolerans]
MTRLKLSLLGLATLALAACGSGEQNGQQKAPAVDVAQVVAAPTTVWRDFTGRVEAPETVSLRPRVSGYIEKVAFNEGELVQRGDVLFEIDPRPYRAQLRAAEADLARARSEMTLAENRAGRAERLLNSRAISREEYDERMAARDSARAAVNAAEAALENARLDLQYTVIEAPISGRVGRAFVTRGNLANADQTLLTTLVSVDPMYVYFESDQRTFVDSHTFFTPEQRPQVRIGLAGEDGYPHSGELDFIDNQLNSHTGTLQFRAVIPNPQGTFKPGQFARVKMPAEQLAHAMLVNSRAVLTDQDRRYVYLVNDKNITERREVVVGPQQDGLTVIRSGLRPGERVVINGLQKIYFPGMPVQPELVAMRGSELPREVAKR